MNDWFGHEHTSGVNDHTLIANPITPDVRPSELLSLFNDDAESWMPLLTNPPRIINDMIVSVNRANTSPTGYLFKCCVPDCNDQTFNRWADFERHDNTFHQVRPKLWCPFPQCKRSETVGNKGYPVARKDKLMEHVRKMHGVEYADFVGLVI
jgi:hypothetical protein